MLMFILFLIAVVFLLMLLSGVVLTVFVARRCWRMMGPIGVAALMLIVVLHVFDVRAEVKTTAAPAHPTEAAWDASAVSTVPLAEQPAAAESNVSEAPAWTQRKLGEWNTLHADAVATVYAGPHLSRTKCEAELDKALAEAVDDYIHTEIAPQSSVKVVIPRDFIRDNLVSDTYLSVTKRAGLSTQDPQDMVEIYALMKIDHTDREQLRGLWRESVVHTRLKTAGAVLAGVLAVLTLAWAVLRRAPQPKNQETHRHAV